MIIDKIDNLEQNWIQKFVIKIKIKSKIEFQNWISKFKKQMPKFKILKLYRSLIEPLELKNQKMITIRRFKDELEFDD